MLHIRPAHEDEKAQVSRLWAESDLGAISDAEWEAVSRGPCARVFVAEDDSEIVGAAVTAFDGFRAYIYHVAVTPQHRGEGLAHKLMAECEQILRARGANRVYLLVGESNTAGLALSAAMGYEPEGDIAFVKEIAPVLATSS